MGRLVPWTATRFSALFRPGTRRPSSSPAAIAAPIHTGRNRSSTGSPAITGCCPAAPVTSLVLVSVTARPLAVVLAWRPAPSGDDPVAGQRHACRGRLRPQSSEPVTVEAVVDPAAPAGRGHQARVAQHAQVVGQQVRRHRHLLLQVAHAPAAPGQHPDDAQPHRVGQRGKADCQFNRARCNNR